MTVQK
jgi:hypothetical protein